MRRPSPWTVAALGVALAAGTARTQEAPTPPSGTSQPHDSAQTTTSASWSVRAVKEDGRAYLLVSVDGLGQGFCEVITFSEGYNEHPVRLTADEGLVRAHGPGLDERAEYVTLSPSYRTSPPASGQPTSRMLMLWCPSGWQGLKVESRVERGGPRPYIIEPPDILHIEPIRLVPKPSHRISPADELCILSAEPLPGLSSNARFLVDGDGAVHLGCRFGPVHVAGMTLLEAGAAIRAHLARRVTDPQIVVGLAKFPGLRQTHGEHMVGMDGTISLGSYGSVPVSGLNLSQAKRAIESHLSKCLLEAEISVNLMACNSKAYYVIVGGGDGEQVHRVPLTGDETVLDAIAKIDGLPATASKSNIWVARPATATGGQGQVLPVAWRRIVEAGDACTNYQLLPGDRLHVEPRGSKPAHGEADPAHTEGR